MTKRKPTPQLREYAVPFRVTLQGAVIVEAASPEAAEEICNEGNWDDDTFFTRAEMVDWTTTGRAKLTE